MRILSSVKQQYLIIGGSLLLAILCYELAFKKTFDLWRTHSRLTQELQQSSDISTSPAYLARKNANLDQIINAYRMDSVSFKNNAVNKIADLADRQKVKFTAVPTDDPLYHAPGFILQKLDFEGDFFPLLQLVHQLQATTGIGMLRSVSWMKKKVISGDPVHNDNKKLVLEVYMEIAR
jgi:hypothetical protein